MERQEKFERQQIDELRRQCLGKVIWALCCSSSSDFGISIARCTGIKLETGEFRLESVNGGLMFGTMIRQRSQAFISEAEIQEFVDKQNRDIQIQYDCNGYTVDRSEGMIRVRPIRILEDEWTGEELIEFMSAENNVPAYSMEELFSLGSVIVRDVHGTALSDAVLNAVRMGVKYKDGVES